MPVRLGRALEGAFVKGIGIVAAIVICFGPTSLAHGQSPAASAGVTLDHLLAMSTAELDNVYRQGVSVAIPEGRIRGTAILSPGTRRTRALSRGARLMWQGKVFEPGQSSAVNRFFGMRSCPGPGLSRAELARRPAVVDSRLQPNFACL